MRDCKDLYEAYKTAIALTAWGKRVNTEDNDITAEYSPMIIKVDNPYNLQAEKDLITVSPYGHGFIQQYVDDLLDGVKNGDNRPMEFSYTYHERLFSYDWDSGFWVNQIEGIIAGLKEQRNTRRAVAVTWKPWDDLGSGDPPCLNHLQFWIRGDRLNLSTTWRSRDILKGFPANVIAISHLMVRVANALDVKLGYYIDYSVIPHIYTESDKDLMKATFEKIVKMDSERAERK